MIGSRASSSSENRFTAQDFGVKSPLRSPSPLLDERDGAKLVGDRGESERSSVVECNRNRTGVMALLALPGIVEPVMSSVLLWASSTANQSTTSSGKDVPDVRVKRTAVLTTDGVGSRPVDVLMSPLPLRLKCGVGVERISGSGVTDVGPKTSERGMRGWLGDRGRTVSVGPDFTPDFVEEKRLEMFGVEND
jgi:hypothetical protein